MDIWACPYCNKAGNLNMPTIFNGCTTCYGAGFIRTAIVEENCRECGGCGGEWENGPGHTTYWVSCGPCKDGKVKVRRIV